TEPGFVLDGGMSVIGHIEVEVAIAINVRQSHRHAGEAALQSRLRSSLAKMTLPIVEKKPHARTDPAHQQVQVAVAIDIRENRAAARPQSKMRIRCITNSSAAAKIPYRFFASSASICSCS